MADVNNKGNVIARCPGCDGGKSTFEWKVGESEYGAITEKDKRDPHWHYVNWDYRLFRCAGCGRGGLGLVVYHNTVGPNTYPGDMQKLKWFFPDAMARMKLPNETPEGIKKEFREAECCLEQNCLRAAAGLFRSVLEKVLRANGYANEDGTLKKRIDLAAKHGIITESRRRKAHHEVRVLGNNILHDKWHEIPAEDVFAARHYAQRVVEDFYDDRESVLKLLSEADRIIGEKEITDDGSEGPETGPAKMA
jgi:hypothetical protein